ncbi:hypothetical protein K493DRAFT_56516 [Basidiobolus meristosporus CBS 931.73]|uniref:Brl1/Brr6 domain-containing protein n=1 Tax=Basidiobolus meristosporus CBS 931.73 TaxID=1314790 RepID=A0A1Y1XZH4_9FUNG|nr:hypothetical protein K493DRAFT_56516 [Basidiobolus meristosporus CBS 931.73]|eukprot:ORX90774.1 hypothetical protein K493DRAFT_56516 [Basidiobolus meristosporus CBS 931.73]
MSFSQGLHDSPMEFEYQSPNRSAHEFFTPSKSRGSDRKSKHDDEVFSTPRRTHPQNFVFSSPESTNNSRGPASSLDTSEYYATDSDDISAPNTEVKLKKSSRASKKDIHKQRRKSIASCSSGSDIEVLYSPKAKNRKLLNRDMPYVLSGWLQLAFNLFLVAITLYIIMQLIYTVQRDVDIKVKEYSQSILQEIEQCSKNYAENRCILEDRVPAMENPCNVWEACIKRDPTVIGRAKVSAETFAEILNNFVEPISYKTMIFSTILIFGSLFLSNFAFGFLRSRTLHDFQYYSPSEPTHHPSGPWVTPRRTHSRYIKPR